MVPNRFTQAMAGFGSTLISLLTIWLAFPTWGLIVYPELATFPEWAARIVNATNLAHGTAPLANVTAAIVNATLH